ncbi:MAG: stage V sporulation protein AD [Clostridiaceae bacterium]|jgi:stage V sporulation protein AD|nr:stage V sporulation protein AD [Clostridiaceae bacterium]
MTGKRLGKQTLRLSSSPSIISNATVVGPKEGEGPLAQYFDQVLKDDYFGEDSWEKAESKMLKEAVKNAIKASGRSNTDINFMFAGDLLNQIVSSSFAARELQIPFVGLYGACSTMAESLCMGSLMIDGGYAEAVVCATSSHFSSAERQYRFPLEQGTQRPPFAQWTVTGAGAAVVAEAGSGPYITHVTIGKVLDFGIKDANNMGAAMAPAAVDTITVHLNETGRSPDYYDLIITGDLGNIGKTITLDMMKKEGFDITKVYDDCGSMIFDGAKQDTHAGGSGCGCSAVVFNGYIASEMKKGNINKILLVATGALLSPTTTWQGESIPCIAHAVAIERTIGVGA